jgi:energy-coupling factor transporter ATP-binding protein EcfA2
MTAAMEFAVLASVGTSRTSLITPVHHFPMHRDQLLQELRRLHGQQENVLLVGPPGIGKTTLLRTLSETLPLTICDETSSLGRLCDCLENRMHWSHEKFGIIVRKNRLLRYLRTHPDPVAFDHVGGASPRVARFIGHLLDDLPVWIACRSDRRRDIGHVWENLYRFIRVEIPPFTEREAAHLIEVAVASGKIQPDAIRHSADLYRISQGSPHILQELITELATREYSMSSAAGLRLLELDRKIHRLDNFERPTHSDGG